MATAAKQQPPLSPRIRSLLRGLRWRIRLYTLLQGLALVACWIALMFWVVLLLDYVPMRFGATELPTPVRAGLLLVVGLGAAYILYRWVLRRTFASLADHSMAVLLERRHGQFHDSLLTAVELNEHPDHARQFNPEMLEHTGAEALAHLHDVRLRRIFRWSPLLLSCLAAVLLAGSVGLFAALDAHGETFEQAVSRIYLLDDEPWERLAYLEVVGVTRYTIADQPRATSAAGDDQDHRPKLETIVVPFGDDRAVTVAQGSSPRLHVRAEVIHHERPSSVMVWWTNQDGWGRNEMESKTQSNADGYLEFTLGRGPLKGIRGDLQFDARGYDYRTGRHTIRVVEAPEVKEVEVIFERPDYLVDEKIDIFKTIRTPLTVGTQAPRGSKVTLVAVANKPLKRAYVYDPHRRQTTVIEQGQSGQHQIIEREVEAEASAGSRAASAKTTTKRVEIHYVIDNFDRDYALEWMLVDEDELVTEAPHLTGLTVRDDQLPQVEVAVRGIGTAVTPDVRLAVAGKMADDYWLQRAWLQVQIGSEVPHQLPLPITRGGFNDEDIAQFELTEGDNVYHWFDMRDERQREDNPLVLTPGDKITLAAVAADRYDLDGFDPETNPHVGAGSRYQIDVVTPDELIALLERRELELRRRLEQKVEELTQTRDSLVRVKNEVSDMAASSGDEPEEADAVSAEPGDKKLTPEEAARRQIALRRLRVQQAVNQSVTMQGELKDVVRALLSVVDQLDNNRVDREDRRQRLRDEVAAPLAALVADDFPELDKRLEGLNRMVGAEGPVDVEKTTLAADHAVAQTEDVLLKLDGVLQKMLDLETFNELIELVRALIDEQDELIKETKTVRRNQVFGLE